MAELHFQPYETGSTGKMRQTLHDALHVVERYTPVTPYHLQYEATIEDPKVFTRPWKISLPLYRHIEANAELSEFKCVPFSEELLYGAFKVEAAGSR